MKWWVIVILAIFGTLVFVGVILGTILGVVLNMLKPRFTIEQYTSEVLLSYNGHETLMRLTSFDLNHFYQEIAYDGDIEYSYIYGTDDTMTGTCSRVGKHHNCYVTSGGATAAFSVLKGYSQEKDVECPVLRTPTLGGKPRTLTSCDLYTTDDEKIWTESGTNYPVKVYMRNVDRETGDVTVIEEEFVSFDPSAPTNRTKLAPRPGVKVYDFRTGHSGLYEAPSTAAAAATSHKRTRARASPQQASEYIRGRFGRAAAAVYERLRGVPQSRTVRARLLRERFGLFDVPAGGAAVGTAPALAGAAARDEIPTAFDVRTQWPYCAEVTGAISNQGNCGSCWAMASAAVVSDRVCIATGGAVRTQYAPQFMVSCYARQLGCSGGRPDPVWHDIMREGLVPEACVPFEQRDEACTGRCVDGSAYPARQRTHNVYAPWGATDAARVAAIQRDLMQHGSVSASYLVFSDFRPARGTGVYARGHKATFDGLHMVRIVGWGEENGVPYWTVANSWGTTWGDNGFFRIRRGTNECNIEEVVLAGEPLLS